MQPTAQKAIMLLTALQDRLGPAYLAYWVLPNTILTLAGARPYCDGVFWDDDEKGLLDAWEADIQRSGAVIAEHAAVIWSAMQVQEARPSERYASYDLLFEDGLRYVLSKTTLLTSPDFDRLTADKSMDAMLRFLDADLKAQARFKDWSDENIRHLSFGLLLGYPDAAVVGATAMWQESGPFDEPLIQADIRGASYYICPQPIYDYPRGLITDESINAHEKLWSGILRDFYESDFHTTLAKDAAFKAKMIELGNIPE